MRGKAFKAVCAALALTVLLSGCSFVGGKNKLSISGTALAGQVTDIKDKTVTMTLGYITEPEESAQNDESAQTGDAQSKASQEPADTAAPASPSQTGRISPEAPLVKDEPETEKPGQQPQSTESPQPSDDTEKDGATAADEQSGDGEGGGAKGVTANVATFTLGNTSAVLEINDGSVLFKEDGSTAAALSDISEGSILEIKLDEKGAVAKIVIRDIPRLITSRGVNYIAANEYAADTELSSDKISSSAADETAVIVDGGAEVGFDSVTIDRSSGGSTGGDSAAMYGVGAALLTTEGKSYIRKSTISTDAVGGYGIFAYDAGKIYAADTKIAAKRDFSGGLREYGGKLYAYDMAVGTGGASSPAISGANGGKLVADGGAYTTEGENSPAVYSAGNIAINGASLIAKASRAAEVDGANSLYIFDSSLSGGMQSDKNGDPIGTVAVYRSASDKTKGGAGTFKMVGGSLQSAGGGLIYTTNTQSGILLSGVDITPLKDGEFFLRCTGNAGFWGETGKNGAECNFTATKQEMTGGIIWDSISRLDFYMTDGSKLTGAVKQDGAAAGRTGGDGYCDMYISANSTWVVTGDSALSELCCEGKIVDGDGNTVTIKDGEGKRLVKGKSKYTVTVEKYETSADLSGVLSAPQWADYKVTRPTGM